jgi:hypothetical protein
MQNLAFELLTAGFSGHDPHRMMHTYGLHKGHGFDRPKVRPSAGGSASMQLAVRIPLPRTPVNKGKTKGRESPSPLLSLR